MPTWRILERQVMEGQVGVSEFSGKIHYIEKVYHEVFSILKTSEDMEQFVPSKTSNSQKIQQCNPTQKLNQFVVRLSSYQKTKIKKIGRKNNKSFLQTSQI